MPIPHFNSLVKPLTLPRERLYEMAQKTHEYLEMWLNMLEYGIKPWDIRGEILGEDIVAMKMLDRLKRDSDIYKERKKIQDQKTADYIASQKALHQPRRR